MAKGFVSFVEVKRAVTMEAVLTRYGLLADLARKGKNLAGPCLFCEGQSARQFQVNPVKNAWYCFGCKAGGNVLDFVAKKERVSVRTAALKLNSWFELGLTGETPQAEAPVSPADPPAASPEAPPAVKELPTENPPLTFTLKTLDPHHTSLAFLGLRSETVERFGAGYCAKGLLKGRMAIPIHSGRGELVAYAGLALDHETPRYLFPPKFHPALEVFNLHRLSGFAREDSPLYLTPEIEGALRISDGESISVLALFDGTLSPQQEEELRGVLTFYERLVLVGEGFTDHTVARLARYATVSWMPDLPTEPATGTSTSTASSPGS